MWVPTSQMIADGFTKPLAPQRHKEFVKALNLQEIQPENESECPDEDWEVVEDPDEDWELVGDAETE